MNQTSSRLPEPTALLRLDSPDAGAFSFDDLRRFHFTQQGFEGPTDDWAPAVVPSAEVLENTYPLVLFPEPGAGEPGVRPLRDVIQELVSASADPVLQEKGPELEKLVVAKLTKAAEPESLREAVQAVAASSGSESNLSGDDRDALKLVAQSIDPAWRVVSFGPRVAFQLLWVAAHSPVFEARQVLRGQVEQLLQVVTDLLRVEAERAPPDAHRLSGAMGPAGSDLMDSAALAGLLAKKARTSKVDEGRARRLESVAQDLRSYLDRLPRPSVILVHPESHDPELKGVLGVAALGHKDPIAEALRQFDRETEALVELHRAIRAAQLEQDGAYDPQKHDAWRQGLNWMSLTPGERMSLPSVFALVDAHAASNEQLSSLGRALRGRRPIRVLTFVDPVRDPGTEDDNPEYTRTELGSIGLAHLGAFTHQSSIAAPEHCFEGFRRAVGQYGPSLHVIGAARSAAEGLGWLAECWANDGRAHPRFVFDPIPSGSFSEGFELAEASEVESAWPMFTFRYLNATHHRDELRASFTFADFALLSPGMRSHFMPVPKGLHDKLIPVDRFLEEQPEGLLPFVWVRDGQGRLFRAVVSARLCRLARERLAYWRTLQEFAGYNSPAVELAVEAARLEAAEEQESLRRELEASHRAKLDGARAEAAGQAASRLVGALLAGPENWGAISEASPSEALPSGHTTPTPDEVDGADPEVATQERPEGPWIETPLCTSCGDCLIINAQVFVYDDNKQAVIGDPRAGTFKEIVKAAEKCPSRCIHPGRPLNPKEPNLAALIARAEAFD